MLSCTITLPHNFRDNDFFEFHGRDVLRIAESVDGSSLYKGLVWEGCAASLTLRFREWHVDAELSIDGMNTGATTDALENMVRRMLGLTQQVEEFERAYRAHPQLGQLIAAHPGLRVPLAATPFEALTWAITGQQISLGAAIALRRKLIRVVGLQHSTGLYCYPDAGQIAALSVEDLRGAGYSQTKAQTLVTLGRLVASQQLALDACLDRKLALADIGEQLLSIRGIGQWTVNYTLLRGFGWLDGSLHGDAAVCRALQSVLGQEKVSADEARQWLAPFTPWRALVAAHLWAVNSDHAKTYANEVRLL